MSAAESTTPGRSIVSCATRSHSQPNRPAPATASSSDSSSRTRRSLAGQNNLGPSAVSIAGASVKQATSVTNRQMAITGPLLRYLPNSANTIAPRPTIVVSALPESASPTSPSERMIAASGPRPCSSSSRYRAMRNKQKSVPQPKSTTTRKIRVVVNTLRSHHSNSGTRWSCVRSATRLVDATIVMPIVNSGTRANSGCGTPATRSPAP